MSKRDELVEVEVTFAYAVGSGWMVFNQHRSLVNIPASVVDLPGEPRENAKIKLDVPAWIAEAKELI